MTNENLNFEASRMRGVLKVMEGDRKRFVELEKKYKALQSEHNILKISYLNLLNDHLDIIDGKNKTIKKLREKVKKQKEEFVNDLKEIGKHDELIMKKGSYYNLVKNQLELGN